MAVLRGYKITTVVENVRPHWLIEYLHDLPAAHGDHDPARQAAPGSRCCGRCGAAGWPRSSSTPGSIAEVRCPWTSSGVQTLFPDGPARLARLSGAPLVFGAAVRLPHGRYRAYVSPPLMPDRDVDAGLPTHAN